MWEGLAVYLDPYQLLLTFSGTVKSLALAGLASLVLASTALAGPAGSEYLPKVPSSGAHSNAPSSGAHSAGASDSSSSSGETTTTTTPPSDQGSGSGSPSGTSGDHKQSKGDRNDKSKSNDRAPVVPLGDSGGGGGDSSGSLLLNPIVLLMIVAVLAAAVGMILRRRRTEEDDAPPGRNRGRESRGEPGIPRTPDGEIIGPGPGRVEGG
jgi:hypothetical protein